MNEWSTQHATRKEKIVMASDETIVGLVAEFVDEKMLLAATQRAYGAGYRAMDAFTPYPAEEIADALRFRRTHVPLVVLTGGLLGGLGGFAMQ
ncbi:MAG: DUF3341 domain-containing protein, partial [Anaerolineae bacterium]|nr:DUF3341 domain-containing protein [Anaerolineae bacterium]